MGSCSDSCRPSADSYLSQAGHTRIGAEYQAVLPAMGQAPRGEAPGEPRLIYAPSSSESRDGQLIPEALRPKSLSLTGKELKRFEDALKRHGKHFRKMMANLPGFTVAQLVEAYYNLECSVRKRIVQRRCGECTRSCVHPSARAAHHTRQCSRRVL